MDTVTNIFRGYRILQLLFCHTVEGARDFKCSQNQLELKFCLHKRHPPGVFCKKGVLKNFAIFKGKYLCQSLFLSRNFIKETLAHRFPCEFCKIFKNTFFTEHLWMTTSILQQLLALYFAIIYSWQLPSSEKSLVEEKIHPYISRILQIQIYFRYFFHFFLCKAYADCAKSVQIRSFFQSVFSCIQYEYRKIRTRKTPYLDTFRAAAVL